MVRNGTALCAALISVETGEVVAALALRLAKVPLAPLPEVLLAFAVVLALALATLLPASDPAAGAPDALLAELPVVPLDELLVEPLVEPLAEFLLGRLADPVLPAEPFACPAAL
jgi:hypothetical protein